MQNKLYYFDFKCYYFILIVLRNYFNNFILLYYRDMLPLPYATKDNYKVILYRLADADQDKTVCGYCVNYFIFFFFWKKK